tara:strand:+ start:67 stop:564 length:498 start_codon:yes stop_codon:yes gene_type:complete
MKIFLIHGAGGSPESNWFPWLKENLDIIIPQMPEEDLSLWLDEIKKYDLEDSILIGHSLGVPFLLKVLENTKIKAAFLVSGFVSKLNNEYDPLVKSFIEFFNFDKIKQNCPKFYIFHSEDDNLVSVDHAHELKDKLNGELILFKDRGHFNQKEFIELKNLLDRFS